MKVNKIFIQGALLFTLALGACHEELLEPTPESILTTSNFYQNAKDMDLAVLGVYSRLQNRKPNDYLLLEIPTDNLYLSANTSVAGAPELDVLSPNSANPVVANYWEANFNGIFRANAVLLNIDKPADYKAGQKDQFIGEAKFMRALYYFDMVRVFGGVPKVTTHLTINAAKETPKATEADIYSLIEEDLKDAIAKLPAPAAAVKGRASKAAAVALLAKTYVYRKDWSNAKTYLEQFLSEFTNHNLVTNFASLWSLTNEYSNEIIFAVRYIDGTNGQWLSTAYTPNAGAVGVVGRGDEVALPSWSLLKKYEDTDTRKAATITEWWRAAARPNDPLIWYPYVSKYAVQHTYGSSGLDLPVIRFADVVLLYAETLYELNQPEQALAQLNKIRERAFGNTTKNYTLADISTKEAFTDKLLLERQLEFAYENERWFDLVRTGRYLTEMTKEERSYNYTTKTPLSVSLEPKATLKYFPIPQRQIDQSSVGVLAQNDGY